MWYVTVFCLTNHLTNFMEESCCREADSNSAMQLFCYLWDLKIHFHVYKRLPLVTILLHSVFGYEL